MTNVTQVSSHTDELLSRVTSQFVGKENIGKLLKIIGEELDELEEVWFELLTDKSLRTAVGKQLDVVGVILNLTRNGMSDEDYRERLRYQIAINASNGTPDELISLTKVLTNVTTVKLEERFPAEVRLTLGGEFPTQAQVNALRDIIPVTVSPVQILMWGGDYDDTDLFVLSSIDGGIIHDDVEGLGFSTTDDLTEGGVMTSIYEVV